MSSEVRIRRHRPEDARALYEAAHESMAEVSKWLHWCHPGYSMQEAEAWIGSRGRAFDDGFEYCFAIVDERDRLLGGCGLNHIIAVHRFANLGYWVRTPASGRGVATSAIRQAAAFAFEETDLVRLEILCALGNGASQRVAEKAGAIREAVLRDRLWLHDRPVDAVMYSILRSTWSDPDR